VGGDGRGVGAGGRDGGGEGLRGGRGGWGDGKAGAVGYGGSGPARRYWAGGGVGGLSLPRVPHHLALGEASSSPSASFLALGEASLPRVLREGTRGTNYFV
jgi:hypothetical protein